MQGSADANREGIHFRAVSFGVRQGSMNQVNTRRVSLTSSLACMLWATHAGPTGRRGLLGACTPDFIRGYFHALPPGGRLRWGRRAGAPWRFVDSSSFDRRNRRMRWARHGLGRGCGGRRKLELAYVAFLTGSQMPGTGGTLIWVGKGHGDRGGAPFHRIGRRGELAIHREDKAVFFA